VPGQARRLEPPLDHPADIDPGQSIPVMRSAGLGALVDFASLVAAEIIL
jgi:hypothetical protein